MNDFLDRLGISTSILCILHCLATPLLVVFAPLLGAQLTHGWFHVAIAVVVFPVAIVALWRGFKLHRKVHVLWIGAGGLILVCLALLAHASIEMPLMIAAGGLLATAHYLNLRAYQRRC